MLIDLQSNPPKRPQSAANGMEGVETTYRCTVILM